MGPQNCPFYGCSSLCDYRKTKNPMKEHNDDEI